MSANPVKMILDFSLFNQLLNLSNCTVFWCEAIKRKESQSLFRVNVKLNDTTPMGVCNGLFDRMDIS